MVALTDNKAEESSGKGMIFSLLNGTYALLLMDENDVQRQYDLLYESITKKLEQQVSALGSIDTKASIILAVVGVIFAGYLQLLTTAGTVFNNFAVLVTLELCMLLAAGFYIFKAFILNGDEIWRDDPRPKRLLEVFADNSKKGEYWLKNEIIKNMSDAYELNDALIVKKYDSLINARRLLYVVIPMLAVHLLLSLFGCIII